MKLKDAKENTLVAGELAAELIDDYCDNAHVIGDDMWYTPLVVKVGNKYLRVNRWEIKQRKGGSRVVVISAEDR